MKTIGILGGLGPESTIAYYQYITRKYYELRSDYAYPEIVIYSFNFSEFIETGYRKPGTVKTAIEALRRAGADFVIATCNSVHIVYDEVCRDICIPWISIMDPVAEQIKKQAIRKVALLGTVFTMGNDFYQKCLAKYDIEVITPDEQSQREINRIVYDDLITAKVKDESREVVSGIINKLQAEGAEGIVLGCTELPFLITAQDTELPVFNSTTIHAQKTLDLALE